VNAPSYHIWLKPSGETYEALSRVISELGRQYGGPVFDPHITLLASLRGAESEHIRRSEDLARQLRPFRVITGAVDYGQEYFQCVFLRIQKTQELVQANAAARRFFGDRAGRSWVPHLSLVYGGWPDDRKRQISTALRLPPRGRLSFRAKELYLIKAESHDPQDWNQIAVFPMDA
jgi:hypothetical protein